MTVEPCHGNTVHIYHYDTILRRTYIFFFIGGRSRGRTLSVCVWWLRRTSPGATDTFLPLRPGSAKTALLKSALLLNSASSSPD